MLNILELANNVQQRANITPKNFWYKKIFFFLPTCMYELHIFLRIYRIIFPNIVNWHSL
jgi:hypothetical protein